MSNWGISPNASEKEKIKADYADILHGMNSTGAITYDVYCDLFDDGMELFDRMYEQGKTDAVPVVRGEWDEDAYPFCNVCKNCNAIVERGCVKWSTGDINFCPNCGADMRPEGGAVDGPAQA